MLNRALRNLTRPLRAQHGWASYCFDLGLPYVRRSPRGGSLSALCPGDLRALVAEQHEICHWRQHRCTAFGSFIGLLRCARDQAMHNYLGFAGEEQIEGVRHRRVTLGLPIVDHRTGRSLLASRVNPDMVEAAIDLAEIWSVSSSFMQLSRSRFLADPTQGYLRSSFAVAELLDTRLKEGGWASVIDDHRPTTGEQAWVAHAYEGDVIDVRDLLEGCASLHELLVLATVLSPSAAEQRLRRIVASSYGKAIRTAFAILELGSLEWPVLHRAAAVVLACFDLAFDAPLFPFVRQRDLTTDWGQLYPPLRFSRALEAARRMSLPKMEPWAVEAFRLDVADEAGLQLADLGAVRLPTPERRRMDRISGASELDDMDPTSSAHRRELLRIARAVGRVGLHDYVAWQSHALGRVRSKETLGFMTDVFFDVEPSALAGRLMRPAVQVEEDDLVFRARGRSYGIFYLFLTSSQYPLFDLFLGRGKLDLPQRDEYGVSRIFHNTLAEAYGLDVSSLLPAS